MKDEIFAFLCQHWEQEGYCPGLREIGEACGCSYQKARNVLNELVEDGRVERFQYVRGWKPSDD